MMLHTIVDHPLVAKLRSTCNADVGKFVLRVVTGCIFIYHGKMKLFGGLAMTTAFFGHIGIPAPGFFAPFVGGVEYVGGFLLIIGGLTRLVGLALTIDMIVAIIANKHYLAWKNAEFELLLLAASLNLFLAGAGCCGLDGWLMKKASKEHQNAMPMAAKS